MSPAVSVIIPVYNAQEYIERCLISLFDQTLESMEYIFVDDCTPDDSFDILEKVLKGYPSRKDQVKIIRMPVNSKQAAARTAGMKAATGEYQIHCDPDDWVEKEMYEKMYIKAKEMNADIVTCRYIVETGIESKLQGSLFDGEGIQALTELNYETALWNKLIRTKLIKENSIYPFNDINCGEDMNVIFRLYSFAKKILSIPDGLYHYNISNEKSITNSSKYQLIQKYEIPNFIMLDKFVKANKKLTEALAYLKIRYKRTLLWPWKNSERDVTYWCKLWPETNRFLRTYPEFSNFQKIYFSKFYKWPIFLKFYLNYLDWRSN